MTLLKEYIAELNRQFSTGLAREHSYRPALQSLLAAILPDMIVINEPARSSCGAPDYIITRRSDNAPVAFVEAKDIDDSDLDGRKLHKEQFERYKQALDRIVFTDYLDFHFYENGEWVENIRLGEIRGDRIYANEDEFDRFVSLMKRFADSKLQKITSASKLASLMASKARLLASTINMVLDTDDDTYASQQIRGQYDAFGRVLLHDITHEEFADIYAQTIAYGMFAARMHDKTPEDFSRQKAATLIPKTNPFLRQIFQSIAGYDLDERIAWIVDDLAMTFAATDMPRIMKGYGANSRHSDPMIHFYEKFLTAYNPMLRKSMGVWYTPAPVVGFIVRSVDEILQKEFNLPKGLADYSKIEHEIINEDYDAKNKLSPKTITKTFHKVQILDPAVGTGTFLAEVVNRIFDKFESMRGMWQGYVSEHLLPRLNGFELLMAPYAIAHLKLDWLLNETGYEHDTDKRLKIYLTNSLEEYHHDVGNVFLTWLSNEANEASRIKRDSPVMVMIGNPPYNVSSSNKGKWITELMTTYKKEPGGSVKLQERNIKNLNDDYVKFIRMAQYFIERNGEGVLAFINPHGFLDNTTFRGMRWELMRVFDAIYTLDLHGSSKKKETAPDVSKDENVFDITQGVSINFFIKTGKKAPDSFGKVYHADLYGLRKEKYKLLEENSWQSIEYKELNPQSPMFFFVPKDLSLQEEYNKGFEIKSLFKINSVGIKSSKDSFNICDSKNDVEKRVDDLINLSEIELKTIYGLYDTRDWSISRAKADVGESVQIENIKPIKYRWGDERYVYYTGLTNGIIAWPRLKSLGHLLHPNNIALLTVRQIADGDWTHVGVSQELIDICMLSTKTKENTFAFPLYTVAEDALSNISEETELYPNLNPDIVNSIEQKVGQGTLSPEEIFDYVYGVLHSKDYREKYKEFLKIDFPKVPYPKDAAHFRYFENIGRELRHLHLMQNSASWKIETTYPVSGSNKVETLRYDDGKVFINETQYFGNVPKETWELFIGGYQPAQKWLKDRKGKQLGFEDIRHYQEIIYSLTKTQEIIQTTI